MRRYKAQNYNLYKIVFEPTWVQRALGTFYIVARNKNEAENWGIYIAYDSRILGSEAEFYAKAVKVKAPKSVIQRLLREGDGTTYRGCPVYIAE